MSKFLKAELLDLFFFFFAGQFLRLHTRDPRHGILLVESPLWKLERRPEREPEENNIVMEDHRSGLGNEEPGNCIKGNTDKAMID